MSEKLHRGQTVSILPCIGGALIAVLNKTGDISTKIVHQPKEVTWLQKQLNRKIKGTGKRRR